MSEHRDLISSVADDIFAVMVPGRAYAKSELFAAANVLTEHFWNEAIKRMLILGMVKREGVTKATRYTRIK
jgi:hypothetical protein